MSNQTRYPSGVFSAAPPPLKPIVVELDENEVTTYGTPNILEGADAPPGSRAVTYLRVSSKGQVNTDYDRRGSRSPRSAHHASGKLNNWDSQSSPSMSNPAAPLPR